MRWENIRVCLSVNSHWYNVHSLIIYSCSKYKIVYYICLQNSFKYKLPTIRTFLGFVKLLNAECQVFFTDTLPNDISRQVAVSEENVRCVSVQKSRHVYSQRYLFIQVCTIPLWY